MSTLKEPLTAAADDSLNGFFFSEKIRLVISCELSALQTIHMNIKPYFFLKNEKKKKKKKKKKYNVISNNLNGALRFKRTPRSRKKTPYHQGGLDLPWSHLLINFYFEGLKRKACKETVHTTKYM